MLARVWFLVALGCVPAIAQPPTEPIRAGMPFVRPDPARSLTAAEAEKLVAYVVVLLDKSAGSGRRGEAMEVLSETIRHRAALPALRFVMHDQREDRSLRIDAAWRALTIGAPEAMGDLVKLLRTRDSHVRSNVWELLIHQYPPGREFGFDPVGSLEHNEPAIKRWEAWWKANKDTFEVDVWEAVFIH